MNFTELYEKVMNGHWTDKETKQLSELDSELLSKERNDMHATILVRTQLKDDSFYASYKSSWLDGTQEPKEYEFWIYKLDSGSYELSLIKPRKNKKFSNLRELIKFTKSSLENVFEN